MLDEEHRQLEVVAQAPMNAPSSSTSSWFSPPAGSSSSSSRGSETSARASSTRFSVPNGRPGAGRRRRRRCRRSRASRARARASARAGSASRVRADEDVLEHGHRREELDVLERPRDPAADDAVRRRVQQRLPSKIELAGVGPVEPRDHVERRRLAGAVRADQADDLAPSTSNETSSSATIPPKRRVTCSTESKGATREP